jgi:hypothetical protein
VVRLGRVVPSVGSRPVHEPEVEVVGAKLRERVLKSLLSVALVGVVELGGQEEGLAGDTGGLDALADLSLVLVGGGGCWERSVPSGSVRKGNERTVDVLVAVLESELDGELDLSGLGLPGACRCV